MTLTPAPPPILCMQDNCLHLLPPLPACLGSPEDYLPPLGGSGCRTDPDLLAAFARSLAEGELDKAAASRGGCLADDVALHSLAGYVLYRPPGGSGHSPEEGLKAASLARCIIRTASGENVRRLCKVGLGEGGGNDTTKIKEAGRMNPLKGGALHSQDGLRQECAEAVQGRPGVGRGEGGA